MFFADPETLAVVEEKRLRGKKELVCLASDGALLVAGSQAGPYTIILFQLEFSPFVPGNPRNY